MSDTLITLTIDGHEVSVTPGSTIMQAAEKLAIEIPHFCYHKHLSVAGNCRMCLVDVEGAPKPVASCHWPAAEGMVVRTMSELTKEARKGTMEMLLVNHPLDCPICDQGGECDLQDIAVGYGSDISRFSEAKRAVPDKEIGPKIKTVMTRCIHCTRCVRFATEIAGIEEFGATFRGEKTEIGTYVEHALQSELAGNMIDLCPVGALTSKPYAFTGRPWELSETNSIDVMDGLGTNITVHHRAGKVMRVVPRENDAVNLQWLSDAGRFSYDALTHNRLTTPLVRKGKKLTATGWRHAFDVVQNALKGNKNVAGLAGPWQAADDYAAFRRFMTDVIGTADVDSRSGAMAVTAENRSDYLFNSTVAGIDNADAILLIGTNPRFEAPVLNARIRRQVMNGARVGYFGPEPDLTYDAQHLGDTPSALATFVKDKKHPFYKVLSKAKAPLIIVGSAVLERKDFKNISTIIKALSDEAGVVGLHQNGYNVLHHTSGQVAALDMAVTPDENGRDTAAIVTELAAGSVDVLVLYGDMAGIEPEMVRHAKTVIYIGTHRTPLADIADIVLPAACYTEKDALWTNTEGRVQRAEAAVMPPHNAKVDWKIFRALSEKLGKTLPFDSLSDLRTLMAEQHPAYVQENWGAIVAETSAPLGAAGKGGTLLKQPFTPAIRAYYVSNPFLKQSLTMQACQYEGGIKNILVPEEQTREAS